MAITKTSLRLEGMSDELMFLVYDEYSNMFFNPAYVVYIDGTRIYTNLSNYQGDGCLEYEERCPDTFLDQDNCDGTTYYSESELLVGGIFQIKRNDFWIGAMWETAKEEWTDSSETATDYDYQVDNHWVEYCYEDPSLPMTRDYSLDKSTVGTETSYEEESFSFHKSEPMAIFGFQVGNWDLGLRLHSVSEEKKESSQWSCSDEGQITADFTDKSWYYDDCEAASPEVTSYKEETGSSVSTYSFSMSASDKEEESCDETLFAGGAIYHTPSFDFGFVYEQEKWNWSFNETYCDLLVEAMMEGSYDWYSKEYSYGFLTESKEEHCDMFTDVDTYFGSGIEEEWIHLPNLEAQLHATKLSEEEVNGTSTVYGFSIEYPWTSQWTLRAYGRLHRGSGSYDYMNKCEGSGSLDINGACSEEETHYNCMEYTEGGERSFALSGDVSWKATSEIDSGDISNNGSNIGIGAQYNWGPTTVIALGVKSVRSNWNNSGEVQPRLVKFDGSGEGEYNERWWYEYMDLPLYGSSSEYEESYEGNFEIEGTWSDNKTITYEENSSYNSLIVPVGVEWKPCMLKCLTLRLGASTRIATTNSKFVATIVDEPDSYEGTASASWSNSDGEGESYAATWNADTSHTIVTEYTFPATDDNYTVTEEWDTEGNKTVTIEYADGTTYTYYYPNKNITTTETTTTTKTDEWSHVSTTTTYSFGATYAPTENVKIDLMHFSDLVDMQKWVLSVTFLFK